MYPFGSVPDNLVAFGRVLRRDYGFRIGPGELTDAARSLELVELSDEIAVRHALRPILSRTAEDAAVFDRAFAQFFFPGPTGAPQPDMLLPRRSLAPGADEDAGHVEPEDTGIREVREQDDGESTGGSLAPTALDEADADGRLRLVRGSYSPLEVEAVRSGPLLTPPNRAWRDAGRTLVRRLQLGQSRRWKPSPRGRRFDVRRTLRAGVQTGGEAIEARWLGRSRRAPRFVVLVDGSRSMERYAETALTLAVAIASATTRIDVFTFSTSLRRVTDDVRRVAAGATRRLEHLEHAWGGGTSIGGCLREFLQRGGGRAMGRDAVVIIASDGLDVGQPDVLREAMRELHRRSAGIIWLNPLLDTPGYEPTAGGMRAASPFIARLASVSTPAELSRLEV